VKLLRKLRERRQSKPEKTDPILMPFGESIEVQGIRVIVNATGEPFRLKIHGNVLAISGKPVRSASGFRRPLRSLGRFTIG